MILMKVLQVRIRDLRHPEIPGKDIKGGGAVDDLEPLSKIEGGFQALRLFDPLVVRII